VYVLLPYHSTRIVETRNVRFIENGEINGSDVSQNMEIKKVKLQVLVASTSSLRDVVLDIVETQNNQEEQHINDLEVNNE